MSSFLQKAHSSITLLTTALFYCCNYVRAETHTFISLLSLSLEPLPFASHSQAFAISSLTTFLLFFTEYHLVSAIIISSSPLIHSNFPSLSPQIKIHAFTSCSPFSSLLISNHLSLSFHTLTNSLPTHTFPSTFPVTIFCLHGLDAFY